MHGSYRLIVFTWTTPCENLCPFKGAFLLSDPDGFPPVLHDDHPHKHVSTTTVNNIANAVCRLIIKTCYLCPWQPLGTHVPELTWVGVESHPLTLWTHNSIEDLGHICRKEIIMQGCWCQELSGLQGWNNYTPSPGGTWPKPTMATRNPVSLTTPRRFPFQARSGRQPGAVQTRQQESCRPSQSVPDRRVWQGGCVNAAGLVPSSIE